MLFVNVSFRFNIYNNIVRDLTTIMYARLADGEFHFRHRDKEIFFDGKNIKKNYKKLDLFSCL